MQSENTWSNTILLILYLPPASVAVISAQYKGRVVLTWVNRLEGEGSG
jgi:hypothetical protein